MPKKQLLKFNRFILLIFLLLNFFTFFSSFSQIALAHQLKLFATAEGNKITGYAYFPGGGRVQQMPVIVLDNNEEKIGEIMTNEVGEFQYTATYRMDHTFILSTGEGHRARYTVTAQELSQTLPPPISSTQNSSSSPKSTTSEKPTQAPSSEITVEKINQSQLTLMIETAVSQQINPLREQLAAYEAKIRLHDILGGIGYIVGIMGLLFYYWGRK
jgi:nickel transport protein